MNQRAALVYELKRRRGQRSIRVSVKPGGGITVTAGLLLPKYMIDSFVLAKRAWINQSVEKMRAWKPGVLAVDHRQEYLANREQALEIVRKRVEYFNQLYQFEISSITIRYMKCQWGSCSRSRRLNFNYKLIFLPQDLMDYVIVHELSHLAEFNHSSRFWQHVSRAIPDWKQRRSALRSVGNGTFYET